MKSWLHFFVAKRTALMFLVFTPLWVYQTWEFAHKPVGFVNSIMLALNILNSVMFLWNGAYGLKNIRATIGRVWLPVPEPEQRMAVLRYCEAHQIHYQLKEDRVGFCDLETMIQVKLSI